MQMSAVSRFLCTFVPYFASIITRRVSLSNMNAKDFIGKFKSPYLWLHLLAMALVVVLLGVGVWYGLDVYTHHGQAIKVPDMNGMAFTKAADLLESDGLDILVSDTGYNKRMPAGCILAQQPDAGSYVKQGRTVYVTINSLQSPRLPLPDLIDNSSYREAEARLKAMGFRLLEPKRIEGEKDWVYGIQTGGRHLQTGDMVSIESALVLIIGNGEYEEEEDMLFDDEFGSSDDDTGADVDDFSEVPDDILEE